LILRKRASPAQTNYVERSHHRKQIQTNADQKGAAMVRARQVLSVSEITIDEDETL